MTIVTNVTIVTFGTSGQNLTILTYVNIVTYVIIVTNVTVVTNVMILTCNNSDICDQSQNRYICDRCDICDIWNTFE